MPELTESRKGLSGPPLVRLLVQLSGADVRQPDVPLAQCLSQWLGWADAIALAAALKGGRPIAASVQQGNVAARVQITEMRHCDTVRAELTEAILEDELLVVQQPVRVGKAQARRAMVRHHEAVDYAVYRQCYLALQQRMEVAIGALRAQLRLSLAMRGPEKARLASVDAVMEQALMEKEYALLGGIPAYLEVYFKRLQKNAQSGHDGATEMSDKLSQASQSWLNQFRQDMQRVLLAELDVRLQPVMGLQAALDA